MLISSRTHQAGVSLVEAIIVAALSVMIFGALFASFQLTLTLIADSRAKLSALSLANERMEYIRSLSYDAVGTVAGFPAGSIPQTSTSTLNGVTFYERVLIEYVDDPADGQVTATTTDDNNIPTDYKRVKVEYSWNTTGATSTIFLVSNIVPRSIESNVGGGTARINVIDANSNLLPGATVRLFNSSSTAPYDVSRTTDASGAAIFSVPADSGYQVEVGGPIGGDTYSTAQTYVATSSNPNPVVAPFTVLEADISTLTFQIDEVSDLDVTVYSDRTEGEYLATLADLSVVASSTNVNISSGQARLADTGGVFESTGSVFIGPIASSSLERWESVRTAIDLPTNTDYRWQLYTASGTDFTLVPDSAFADNSSGFTSALASLQALDPLLYPEIYVGITLETSDTSVSPLLEEVGVYYRYDSSVAAGETFTVEGEKIIGTDASSADIYKFSTTSTTDGSGEFSFSELEFDTYTFTPAAAAVIAAACPAHPLSLDPGVDVDLELLLAPASPHSLRVSVVDPGGTPVPGAAVTLERSGVPVERRTDSCGQAFFPNTGEHNDFRLEVVVPGYAAAVLDPFSVSGSDQHTITLTP